MKDKILKHFQTNYCVKMGHPTDKGVPATNMIYYIVAPKEGGNGRGEMGDTEFVNQILKEIGEEYETSLFMLVIQTSNEFITSICGKQGIKIK